MPSRHQPPEVDQAVAQDETQADSWVNLAKRQARSGDLDASIASLTRAVQIAPTLKTFMTLASLENSRKNWPAADKWFAQAEALDQAAVKIPCMRGAAAAAQGLYRQAAQHYGRALALSPRDVEILQSLCYVLAYSDRDAVIEHLEQFLAAPDLALADRVMALRLLVTFKEARAAHPYIHEPAPLGFRFTIPEIQEWLRLATAWVQQEPMSYDALQMLTQSFIAAGNPMAAEPYFARLRQIGKKEVGAVTFLDPSFHAGLDAISLETMQQALPPVLPVCGRAEIGARFIWAGCDVHYAEKFAGPLLASFAQDPDPDTLFLLHIFDATAEETERFMQRVRKLGDARIVITGEWTGLRDDTGARAAVDVARGYYHAVRYIRFFEAMKMCPGTPAWLVDADMMFNRPPAGLFESLQERDVACSFGAGRLEVHNQIAAGAVGIAPSEPGLSYLHRVAAYLFHCWQQGRLPWGVDQAALYCVSVGLAATEHAPRFADLPSEFLDGDFKDDAILWGGKCSPEHPNYDKYLARVNACQLPGADA